MNLNDFITKGIAAKGGTVKELADYLGIRPNALSDAKSQRIGLPGFACVKLAQLIGEDERVVIAASELVTEKNPERRAIWLPFVRELAIVIMTFVLTIVTNVLSPTSAHAGETKTYDSVNSRFTDYTQSLIPACLQ